jgi:exopolysaccharide biosynthesis polyprenyl glycosylphosphotransferase
MSSYANTGTDSVVRHASKLPRSGPVKTTPPRKRPHSVQVDGSLWVQEGNEKSQPDPRSLRPLLRKVLPQPVGVGDRWKLWTQVATDFCLIFAVFLVVSQANALLHWELAATESFPAGFALVYSALVTLMAQTEGIYNGSDSGSFSFDKLCVFRTTGWMTAFAVLAAQLSGFGFTARWERILAVGLLTSVGMLGTRSWQSHRAAERARNGRACRNVVIVGANQKGRAIASYLERNHKLGRVVCGFVDDHWSPNADLLGTVADLPKIARVEFIDEIILATGSDASTARNVIRQARRLHIATRVVPEIYGYAPSLPSSLGNLTVLTLYEEPLPAASLFFKRQFDILCSLLGLIVLGLVLPLVALRIRLDTRGPVFYKALRAGYKGRCFLCYKFRTMAVNANERKDSLRAQNQRAGPFFKIQEDPRITRVGRFLRRYSIDEFPQLWNVLKGDMSMVGPRPHPMDDVARYELPDLHRLSVRPGITGLWQVTARGDPSFERNLALDERYIEEWSLWLDIKILFRTVSAVLRGGGA